MELLENYCQFVGPVRRHFEAEESQSAAYVSMCQNEVSTGLLLVLWPKAISTLFGKCIETDDLTIRSRIFCAGASNP